MTHKIVVYIYVEVFKRPSLYGKNMTKTGMQFQANILTDVQWNSATAKPSSKGKGWNKNRK